MTETAAQPRLQINAQYVKDLSFENPNSPASLSAPKDKPRIDVSVDIQANALQENVFEVALRITANATDEKNKAIFLTELTYAGVFTLGNIADADREMILMIYAPNMLFPFARRVIADATRDGGFPPLMLEPIDFAALYHKRKAADAQEEKEKTAATVN